MIAIIDIGSNSVRLMLSENGVAMSKRVRTSRLGDGLAMTGVLRVERMECTLSIIKEYIDIARGEGVEQIFIYATEAVRVATNRDIFLDMVQEETGISVDVVPSEVEARLGFIGAYTGVGNIAVVDIGGASTEIIVGNESGIRYAQSVHIGCVRMRDKCGEDDALLDEYITAMIEEYGNIPCDIDRAIFVAGTASTVAMMLERTDEYDVSRLDGIDISIEDIRELLALVKATPIDERETIVGLPRDRADIMYGGIKLIERLLTRLGVTHFQFSDRDSLEGYERYLRTRHIIA